MKSKYITILLLTLLCLAGCKTIKQAGGAIALNSPLSKTNVEQVENAAKPAELNYNEEGITIPYNKGDEIEVVITHEKNGNVIREIDFRPQNKGEATILSVKADANTGSSFQDMTAELDVFLEHSQLILWVGLGFLVAGGIFGGIFRDVRSGIILGGLGSIMLIGYAVLPQFYSNWLLILAGGAIIIPLIWFMHFRQYSRIAKASVKAHEVMKVRNPELAKETSLYFKEHIKPKDLTRVKRLRQ